MPKFEGEIRTRNMFFLSFKMTVFFGHLKKACQLAEIERSHAIFLHKNTVEKSALRHFVIISPVIILVCSESYVYAAFIPAVHSQK